MIKMLNIDQHIWDLEFLVVDIIKEFQQTGSIVIDLNSEGPDASELGLYKLLDSICDKYKIDKKLVTIKTCNQLEAHPEYHIVKSAPLYINSGQHFARINQLPEKNWDDIKRFGIFISRSSWQRLWMTSYIWKNHRDSSILTYHYDSNSDYHKSHLGFNELAHELGVCAAVDIAAEFLKTLPQKNQTVDSYPILTPAHFAISKLYNQFFVEIVCETFLAGNSFYPTEKTWRPLICRTPFLMIGPRNFLSNLRKLGFQTFSNWWNEGYDEDAGNIAIENIQQTVKRLSAMSADDLHSMYQDMQPVLDHNYETFMNLNERDFSRIFP